VVPKPRFKYCLCFVRMPALCGVPSSSSPLFAKPTTAERLLMSLIIPEPEEPGRMGQAPVEGFTNETPIMQLSE
jgi:hypothetical protein